MPNLADLMEMAEALESKAVYVAADRCVAVRNRHSSCRKCAEACPVDAVELGSNSVKVDVHTCVGCGACTAVCPTEALVPLDPLDTELAAQAAKAMGETGGVAVFGCARIASHNEGDPDKFAVVPCLARLEESLLLQLAAAGAQRIVAVDGTCRTCKYRATVPGIEATISSANDLLAAQGSDLVVERSSEFPPEARARDERKSLFAARRGFFTQAGGMATHAAKIAAEKAVSDALGRQGKDAPTLRDLLRTNDAGTLPQFSQMRHMHVLDALDALGAPCVPEVTTRLFGSVSIDGEACSACGMCTVFCPTAALTRSEEEPEDGEGSYLEFSAADCVQCNLCADACLKQCLEVSPTVETAELFDFAPRLIHLPNPPARTSILSRIKKG